MDQQQQDQPQSSHFYNPSPPTRISYSRTDSRTFSDGSHNLRRSLNVAQNLSRLADLQIVPSDPYPISSVQNLSQLQHINQQTNLTSANMSQVTSNPVARMWELNQGRQTSSDIYYRQNSDLSTIGAAEGEGMVQDEMDGEDSDTDEIMRDHLFIDSTSQGISERLTQSQRQDMSNSSQDQQNGHPTAQNQLSGVLNEQQLPQRRPVPPTPQRTSSQVWPRQETQSQPQLRLHERHPQEHHQYVYQYRPAHPQPYHQPQLLHQQRRSAGEGSASTVEGQQSRPAFLSQPVYQLACAACIRPLCLRAMKAVMLSDHSKELYSTDMPPVGLQLVNEDRQVRHCACRIRDSACLGCGQVAGYHVTQPCSDCLSDQNNGHFWMFYSSAVYHYKRNRIDDSTGNVMLWANVPSISYDQSLSQQLRLEVPVLRIQTGPMKISSGADNLASNDRPMTACVEMDEWLNSPMVEVVCR